MDRIRKGFGLAAASALVAGGLLGGTINYASAQDASPAAEAAMPPLPAGCTVLASGLANPRHVTVAEDGTVYVALAGSAGDTGIFGTPAPGTPAAADPLTMYGDSGAVVSIAADGTVTQVGPGLPSFTFGTEVVGPAGVAVSGTTLYVVTGGVGPGTPAVDPMAGRASVWAIDLTTGEGQVVADLEAFEKSSNPDPNAVDSDPYGIAVGTDGIVYVAEAGGNDVLKVDPTTGEVSVLAVIPGLAGQQENPARGGAMEIDPVPTGLAWAPDGGLYVSTLSGGPFIPGTAALFHVALDGTVTQLVGGLTMLGDVAVAPDGTVYGVTMSDNFLDPAGPAAGSVVAIDIQSGANQPAITGIPFPGGIAFDADGNAYVTAMVSLPADAPAGGMVLKCDASSLMMAAPEATPAG